ncbi:hypothetical protein ACFL2X_04750 [Candidatus Latescibacterota bacterium]
MKMEKIGKMSKRTKIGLIALLIIAGISSQAFCQDKKYGIGVMLGEPTGFSAKVWRDKNVAYNGGVAWSLIDDKHFNAHSDVLWHNWKVLDDAFEIDDTGRLPLYYGIGGRIKSDNETRVGMRFVVGTSFIFSYAPFDIFFELAPVMDIIPKTELDLNVSFGGRFLF